MKVLITGGGGFIGYRLARKLLERGTLAGPDGKPAPVTQIKLLDGAFPPDPDPRLVCVPGDLSAPGLIGEVLDRDTASVFHLAAVVSAGAEADFDLGYRVNLDGMRSCSRLPQACAAAAPCSRVRRRVRRSAGVLDDSTTPNPQTSYGAQKVIGEYLVTDFTRKGFIDGRSLRLPTIVVRAGKPNLAASSFASSIFREPCGVAEVRCREHRPLAFAAAGRRRVHPCPRSRLVRIKIVACSTCRGSRCR
jgi:nucleoside-diphosphate-sugar epimerase